MMHFNKFHMEFTYFIKEQVMSESEKVKRVYNPGRSSKKHLINIFVQQHLYFRQLLHFPVMILGIKNPNAF